MPALPNVRLNLANRLENVELVRTLLAATADLLGLDALDRDGLLTVAAETCKNVVHHAYDGAEGPLEVELFLLEASIELLVRDHGMGIRPHIGERRQPHTGIGMPMVHLLSRRVTYTNLPNGGTEVLVEIPLGAPQGIAPLSGTLAAMPFVQDVERRDTIELSAAPAAVIEVVIPPVLSALARRSGLEAGQAERLAGLGRAIAERSDPAGAQPLWLLAEPAADGGRLVLGPLEDPGFLLELGAPPLFSADLERPPGRGWPAGTVAMRLTGT